MGTLHVGHLSIIRSVC
ncbi:hypothetical protein [Candidatus Vallotia lariciata]